MRMSINEDRMVPRFLIALLQTPHIKSQILGCAKKAVNQASINQTDVRGLRIFEPPIALQREYVRRIELCVRLQNDGAAQRTEVMGFNSALNQRAFRGELDLSRLLLVNVVELPAPVSVPAPPAIERRFKRPGSFIAPPEIEAQILALEDWLGMRPGNPVPWSDHFFKYRTLSQVLTPPFGFNEIWEAVRYDMEDADYEEVKAKVFEYIEAGILEQRFDMERKEIVFYPHP